MVEELLEDNGLCLIRLLTGSDQSECSVLLFNQSEASVTSFEFDKGLRTCEDRGLLCLFSHTHISGTSELNKP